MSNTRAATTVVYYIAANDNNMDDDDDGWDDDGDKLIHLYRFDCPIERSYKQYMSHDQNGVAIGGPIYRGGRGKRG